MTLEQFSALLCPTKVSIPNFLALRELVSIPDGGVPGGDSDLVRMHLRARRGDTRFRVAYLNHLHAIIARPGRIPEIPRNKVGAALVGDFDCIDADVAEQVEAILRAEGLWTEDKTK